MSADDAPRVVLIGMTGLSASGKSTMAHHLARGLHSPFHPICLDDFYDPSACERLGTFDDYRTIDYARLVRELRRLRALMLTSGQGWREAVHRSLPTFAAYVVDAAPAVHSAEAGVTAMNVACNRSDDDGEDGYYIDEKWDACDCRDDEDSLIAHEAEEAQLRRTRIIATTVCRHGTTGSDTMIRAVANNVVCSDAVVTRPRAGISRSSTIFIICEGFSLFCDSVVSEADLFDVCVWVRVPPEVACTRRFNRTPRRHPASAAASYRSRLERMWASRTERRRCELMHALSAVLETDEQPYTETEQATMRRDGVSWRGLLRVGSESPFFPPPLTTSKNESTLLWDPETGAATDVFLAFWESLPQWELSSADALNVTWRSYLLSVTTSSAPSVMSVLPDVGEERAMNLRYAAFRYWFFFEVVYYHFLFLPLQQLHVAQRFRRGRTDRLVRTLTSSADTTREEMGASVDALASELILWGRSKPSWAS